MRKACAWFATLAIVLLYAGQILAQEKTSNKPGLIPNDIAVDQPTEEAQTADDAYDFDYCGCRRGCRQGLLGRHYSKYYSVGAFNCSCRGSYKFPVLPQYTYHWPGMYSQRTMTEYNSPFRFPPLQLPRWEPVKPKDQKEQTNKSPVPASTVLANQNTGQVNVPSRTPKTPLVQPELISQKIKRHYGLR